MAQKPPECLTGMEKRIVSPIYMIIALMAGIGLIFGIWFLVAGTGDLTMLIVLVASAGFGLALVILYWMKMARTPTCQK